MKKDSGKQLKRLQKICHALQGCEEKLSHGEPTFFVHKKVFVMFSNNHHGDGHIAALVPTRDGLQQALIEEDRETYFYPAYVGCKGWVGIELQRVSDEALQAHITEAWEIISAKSKSRPATARRSL